MGHGSTVGRLLPISTHGLEERRGEAAKLSVSVMMFTQCMTVQV